MVKNLTSNTKLHTNKNKNKCVDKSSQIDIDANRSPVVIITGLS